MTENSEWFSMWKSRIANPIKQSKKKKNMSALFQLENGMNTTRSQMHSQLVATKVVCFKIKIELADVEMVLRDDKGTAAMINEIRYTTVILENATKPTIEWFAL